MMVAEKCCSSLESEQDGDSKIKHGAAVQPQGLRRTGEIVEHRASSNFLLEVMRQLMVKENVIKQLLKQA